MYKNIERLQIAKGPKHFNFIPKSFMIPNEYSEFAAAHHRMRGRYFVETFIGFTFYQHWRGGSLEIIFQIELC